MSQRTEVYTQASRHLKTLTTTQPSGLLVSLLAPVVSPSVRCHEIIVPSAAQSPLAIMSTRRPVTFVRDGLKLVGNLFTPRDANLEGPTRYPAVIVQGSFTSVKEMMSEMYCTKLASKNFLALAFDYAHWGESEGRPRQFESPDEKKADLQSAVSYLSSLPFVSSIGVVGICTSASNVANLAATGDTRIKAIATVAGYLPTPSFLARIMGEENLKARIARADAALDRYQTTGEVETAVCYSETDKDAINYNPIEGTYDYYTNKTRGNVAQYRNEAAVMSMKGFYSLDPLARAGSIVTPTIVIHSDGCAFPNQAKAFYDHIAGVKELAWLDGTHYDYYDNPKQVDQSVDQIVNFFTKHFDA